MHIITNIIPCLTLIEIYNTAKFVVSLQASSLEICVNGAVPDKTWTKLIN